MQKDLETATAGIDPPLVALDGACGANAADLVRRAGGKPVRVASKSVRCRRVLDLVLATPGFAGVMAYSLPEAIWLVRNGVRDVLLGYPSADRAALADLATDPELVTAITLMVDGADQLALMYDAVGETPLRLCIDVDASLRIGRLHLGVRRSPVRTPGDAAALARAALARGLRVVGVMFVRGADRRATGHLAGGPAGQAPLGGRTRVAAWGRGARGRGRRRAAGDRQRGRHRKSGRSAAPTRRSPR